MQKSCRDYDECLNDWRFDRRHKLRKQKYKLIIANGVRIVTFQNVRFYSHIVVPLAKQVKEHKTTELYKTQN